MGFTVICNKCGERNVFENDKKITSDYRIDIDVTEDCGYMGCTVESIDIMCWECSNEVNI